MKSICVTGGNGLLGTKLLDLAHQKYRIISLDCQNAPLLPETSVEYVQCDITDREKVNQILSRTRPEAVFHTAAFTDVDRCELEKEKCWNVNVRGTENVALACKAIGAKMIHISTDYVFDGTNGPYSEEDIPNPISYYGKTKWESEQIVKKILEDFVIVRTTVLYGYAPGVRLNFVTWLIEKLRNHEPVYITEDQYGTPTLADDLAKALLMLFEKNRTGIYNGAGREYVNRYVFAQKVAEIFGLNCSFIFSTSTEQLRQPAPRPKKGGLKIDKLTRDLGISFSDVREGLIFMKDQMKYSK